MLSEVLASLGLRMLGDEILQAGLALFDAEN